MYKLIDLIRFNLFSDEIEYFSVLIGLSDRCSEARPIRKKYLTSCEHTS